MESLVSVAPVESLARVIQDNDLDPAGLDVAVPLDDDDAVDVRDRSEVYITCRGRAATHGGR
jgi:hypothetical protein